MLSIKINIASHGDILYEVKSIQNVLLSFIYWHNFPQFVVKFIRKEKVLEECWVKDYETDSMIPLEIALLAK